MCSLEKNACKNPLVILSRDKTWKLTIPCLRFLAWNLINPISVGQRHLGSFWCCNIQLYFKKHFSISSQHERKGMSFQNWVINDLKLENVFTLNQSKTKLQLPLADMWEILMCLFKTSIVADLVLTASLKMVRRENLWS